jgi:hypothetical protein
MTSLPTGGGCSSSGVTEVFPECGTETDRGGSKQEMPLLLVGHAADVHGWAITTEIKQSG